ncbi:MAG: hypothetical protein IPP88_19535 [Betaproteobacteria bacterium]|nr:hypothetical protein [Betaproteobacteria bacterium]
MKLQIACVLMSFFCFGCANQQLPVSSRIDLGNIVKAADPVPVADIRPAVATEPPESMRVAVPRELFSPPINIAIGKNLAEENLPDLNKAEIKLVFGETLAKHHRAPRSSLAHIGPLGAVGYLTALAVAKLISGDTTAITGRGDDVSFSTRYTVSINGREFSGVGHVQASAELASSSVVESVQIALENLSADVRKNLATYKGNK